MMRQISIYDDSGVENVFNTWKGLRVYVKKLLTDKHEQLVAGTDGDPDVPDDGNAENAEDADDSCAPSPGRAAVSPGDCDPENPAEYVVKIVRKARGGNRVGNETVSLLNSVCLCVSTPC